MDPFEEDIQARLRRLPLPAAPPWKEDRPSAWGWKAAAALLLLAAGWAALRERRPVPRSVPPLSAPKPASRLWVRGPAEVSTPLGTLVVECGQTAMVLDSGKPSLLLREAAADGEGLTLFLLEQTRVRLGKDSWEGPCRVRLPGGGKEPLTDAALAEAMAWKGGEGAWHAFPSGTLLVPLPDGVEAVALEAEYRAPAGTQVALCFPQGGHTAATVLDGGEGWRRVRMERGASRLEVLSGMRILVDAPLPVRESLPPAASRPSVGIQAFGRVEVRLLRWKGIR